MNHHRIRLMAVTVTSLLLLAACGTTTTATTQPVSGGILNVAFKDDPKTLDPAVAYDTTSWAVERSIYNGLLDYKGFTTQLAPDIAETMHSITEGGQSYTVK